MTTFTDDFNRADSSDLGAGWVEVSGDWSIVSGQLSPGAAGGTIILRAAAAMASSDNSAQITIAATTSASQGIWCRGNANITSGYLWRNSGTSWDLFAVVGGSFTMIGTYAAAAAPGDLAKVQAVGSTIKAFVNGVERVSVTDTGVTSGTSVGIRSESAGALRYDDFTGADVSAAVVGSAAGVFGALAGAAPGVRTVPGSAAGSLGGLAGAATGRRRVNGAVVATFGGMAGAAAGTRKVVGAAALAGGTLTGGAVGSRSVSGSATTTFGGLAGHASTPSDVVGSASGTFGGLYGTARSDLGGSMGGAAGDTGSWYGLLAIYQEAADIRRDELERDPQACPRDGEPLVTGPDGELFCRFDGWRPHQPSLLNN
ncbi:MAG TPA: hypothetical protein VFG15_06325 [Amycolatopsis sp.]|nr:hypothetical protein [Amycolatopsis sp.]